MIEPSFRCSSCNGRSTLRAKVGDKQRFFKDYSPSRLERISASINALSCTFVLDATTNIYCFYSIFRESRRLRESVENCLQMLSFLSLTLAVPFCLDLALGLPPFLYQFHLLFF